MQVAKVCIGYTRLYVLPCNGFTAVCIELRVAQRHVSHLLTVLELMSQLRLSFEFNQISLDVVLLTAEEK